MVAAAIVGTAAVGAIATTAAGNKQAGATKEAAAIGNQQYMQTREDMKPWRDAGLPALDQLSEGTKDGGIFNRNFTLADFVKDPGYDFRMKEGLAGVEQSAAARGGLLSGGAGKALEQYGQNFASNEFGNAYNRWNSDITNRFNRLSGIAGTAQTATRDVASAGADNARTIGDMVTSGAAARGSGYVGAANSISSGTSSLANWYTGQQYLKKFGGSSGGYGGGSSSPSNADLESQYYLNTPGNP